MPDPRQRVPASPEATPPARQPPHLDALLDEALEDTFPASDPAAILEPGGGDADGGQSQPEKPHVD